MFAIMRKRVLFEITAVPNTQMNKITLNMTFVILNTLFHVSISDDVRLSSEISRNTSQVFGSLLQNHQRKTLDLENVKV